MGLTGQGEGTQFLLCSSLSSSIRDLEASVDCHGLYSCRRRSASMDDVKKRVHGWMYTIWEVDKVGWEVGVDDIAAVNERANSVLRCHWESVKSVDLVQGDWGWWERMTKYTRG